MNKHEKYDVVVAGGGCSGIFAAIAAAREGAKTLLVERSGMLGGNSGPGFLFGCVDPFAEGDAQLLGGNTGLTAEAERRANSMKASISENRLAWSGLFSHVMHGMIDEHRVDLATPAWASDPILADGNVRGLYIETKSGRLEVETCQVIDATGEADVAMRAGCRIHSGAKFDASYSPIIEERYDRSIDPTWSEDNWNEAGLMFVISGIDWNAYRAEVDRSDRVVTDGIPIRDTRRSIPLRKRYPRAVMSKLEKAFGDGSFLYAEELRPGLAIFWQYRMIEIGAELAESAISVQGDYDAGDWRDVALLEHRMRRMSYDACEFLRRNMPGCAGCYLLSHSPFIGHRGGPFIEGEYTVTPADIRDGRLHDDVVLRATWEARKITRPPDAEPWRGYDIPFRMIVPKIGNLLVAGRGASYIRRGHDPATRARIVQYHLGEVAGIAAAMCCVEGRSPQDIDIRTLQRRLIDEGFTLGEEDRLRSLGLGSG